MILWVSKHIEAVVGATPTNGTKKVSCDLTNADKLTWFENIQNVAQHSLAICEGKKAK